MLSTADRVGQRLQPLVPLFQRFVIQFADFKIVQIQFALLFTLVAHGCLRRPDGDARYA